MSFPPFPTIITQPAPTVYTVVAYRPIIFVVHYSTSGDTTIYCDIYFSGVFYKTISSTVRSVPGSDYYQFDIQDAAQEYLSSTLPSMYISDAAPFQRDASYNVDCYCKFRGSTISGGILTPQGTIPIQGTVNSAPVSGDGTQSNDFYITNATLQQQDNQDYIFHIENNWPLNISFPCPMYLVSHKTQGITEQSIPPGSLMPVIAESGFFPVYIQRDAYSYLGFGNASPCQLQVAVYDGSFYTYYLGGGSPTQFVDDEILVYVPFGVKQLSQLTGFTSIPASVINSGYYIQIFGNIPVGSFGSTLIYGFRLLWRSPFIKRVSNFTYGKRVTFLNRLGAYDSVKFANYDETFTTTSSTREVPLTIAPVDKNIIGKTRYNVRSHDTGILEGTFSEADIIWLKELLDSPKVYLECKGTQGQPDYYLPIRVLDSETPTRISADRSQYQLIVKYEPSNENIIIRN